MKILYICPRFPYPPDQGDKIVAYNHIKFLSKRNEITLLGLIKDKKERDHVAQLSPYCARIEVFEKRPNFSIANFIEALLTDLPFTMIRYYSKKMFKRSKELIESGDYDVIHVSHYYMAQYAVSEAVRIPQKTVTLLDTHHIQYLILLKFSRLAKNPAMRFLVSLEAARTKRHELGGYKRFDGCLAASELDKRAIEDLSGASNIYVNRFGMEAGRKEGQEEENTIIFFGTFAAFPNRDGITYFYNDVFPVIKKAIPDVKFIIAGENPQRFERRLGTDPNVRLAGFVSDIRGLLGKMAVVVVPLRIIGGGITIKILESWAVGKAVVSTSCAAEGIQTVNGQDIVLADSAGDFAEAVIGLLKNKPKRDQIGAAALKKIHDYYDPGTVAENLETIYKNVLSGKTRAITPGDKNG